MLPWNGGHTVPGAHSRKIQMPLSHVRNPVPSHSMAPSTKHSAQGPRVAVVEVGLDPALVARIDLNVAVVGGPRPRLVANADLPPWLGPGGGAGPGGDQYSHPADQS